MNIIISGGPGSGKTLTVVRFALESNNVLANFQIKRHPNFTRLKWEHLINETKELPEGCKKPVVTKKVNWQFWNDNRGCDVFLDEFHNVMNSRMAMSKENRLLSEWYSQIRKIWGSSGDVNLLKFLRKMPNGTFNRYFPIIIGRSRNLWMITQRPRKVDINIRDLCHIYIQCSKVEFKIDSQSHVFIINDVWIGNDNCDAIQMAEIGVKPKRSFFYANPFFNSYDSYEIIGMEGYL